jgi:hypothetical protein
MNLQHNKMVLRELLQKERINQTGRPTTDYDFNKAIQEADRAEKFIKVLAVTTVSLITVIVLMLIF